MEKIKALRYIVLVIPFLISCKKNSITKNHHDETLEKIINLDNKAFIGDWERIEMVTWDYQDNHQRDNSRVPLKISKKYWITENSKSNYDMEIYIDSCGFYRTKLIIGENIVPFREYGWNDQMRFIIYEYPDDPNISRIDRRYKPSGYPD